MQFLSKLFQYLINQLCTYYIVDYTKGGFDMVDFGNTLKTLRIQHNMTQSQLSQKLGLTKSVISAYENGLRMPSYDVLIAISKLFKVTTDYLLGIENKYEIDLSGLSKEEIDALLNLINAIKKSNTTLFFMF